MFLAAMTKIHESGARALLIRLNEPVTRIKNKSVNERQCCSRISSYYFDDKYHELYDFYKIYPKCEVKDVYNYKLSGFMTTVADGILRLADTQSKYYNVINGRRLTTDVPPPPPNQAVTVNLFGNCWGVGVFAEDKYTIASFLQRRFNRHLPGIAVSNCSNWGQCGDIWRQILSSAYEFSSNDIIVIIAEDFNPETLKDMEKISDCSFFTYLDFSENFQRSHPYGEIFFDHYHTNHLGYALMAKMMFPHIKDIILDMREKSAKEIAPGIKAYLERHDLVKLPYQRIGALVMNCNPLTKGHEYLIHFALSQVDFLYLFIVQEDRSFFPFIDRLNIVRRNLGGIEKIRIVPSGQVMISQATLPEYFNKDDAKSARLDSSRDLALFCGQIAPALGITHRFAGAEPACPITKQYNDAMAATLPRHGIRFVEISRAADGGQPISATLVRRHLIEKRYDRIRPLVSARTFHYLVQRGYIPRHCLENRALGADAPPGAGGSQEALAGSAIEAQPWRDIHGSGKGAENGSLQKLARENSAGA